MNDDVEYPVRTRSGRELTEHDVERLADAFEADTGAGTQVTGRLGAVRRGRPSLTGQPTASPRVSFRATDDLRTRAENRAAREGKSVSQIAREALEHYLDAG